ncbi:hypothetical protein L7F22_022767 [Adiantum nelumboides]|nr:hypothetical protein [Adiantum nelumboides]
MKLLRLRLPRYVQSVDLNEPIEAQKLGKEYTFNPSTQAIWCSQLPKNFKPRPPLFLSVFLCVVLGTLLQFTGSSLDRTIKQKQKTGDTVRNQKAMGTLGNPHHAPTLQLVHVAFQKELEKLNHPYFQESLEGVKAKEYFEFNSSGVAVFTRSSMPQPGLVKAVVFICQGYNDTCTFFFEGVARKLAKSGYALFEMNYLGFGLSSGLNCYVPSFNRLVKGVKKNYYDIIWQQNFKKLPCFMFQESMGGTVALTSHLKNPKFEMV